MFRPIRIILALLALALLPAAVSAQQLQRETVTAQVNVTTPAGTTYLGTVVGERSVSGEQATTAWTFNGTVNGLPADAAGTAVERWTGNGYQMSITSVDAWNVPFDRAILPQSFNVSQVSSQLISIYGLPVAIDQPLQPPGSGNTAYTVTVAGQGSPPVAELPNTAGDLPLRSGPLGIGMTLIVAGLLLIGASRLVRRRGWRSPALSSVEE